MDAYIRVSRRAGREGESFQSPEIQAEQIARWAKLNGVTIGEQHVDIDQSGGKFTRPGFDKAMRRIETGQTGGSPSSSATSTSSPRTSGCVRLWVMSASSPP